MARKKAIKQAEPVQEPEPVVVEPKPVVKVETEEELIIRLQNENPRLKIPR